MAVESVKIVSKDGAQIVAPLYRSDETSSDNNGSEKTLFVLLPAMGVKASFYKPVAEILQAKGYNVLLCDLRGQGTSNRKPPTYKFGYAEILELDLPAYIEAAKHACPQNKIILLGHSLGGHLSLLYKATNPKDISAVAIIASGSVYYRAYQGIEALKIWIGTQSSVLVSTLFGYFPGHKLGFGGKQPKALMRDWARQGRTGNFLPKGAQKNYEAALSRAAFPIFALSLEGDNFAPHSAADHLVSKLPKAHVKRVYYKPPAGIKEKIDHFRWVKHSDDIAAYLTLWAEHL